MKTWIAAAVSLAVSLLLTACMTAGSGTCTYNSGVWTCTGGAEGR